MCIKNLCLISLLIYSMPIFGMYKIAKIAQYARRTFSSSSSGDVRLFQGTFGATELKGAELEEYSKYKDACKLFSELNDDIEKLEQLQYYEFNKKIIYFRSENVPVIAYLHKLLQKPKNP